MASGEVDELRRELSDLLLNSCQYIPLINETLRRIDRYHTLLRMKQYQAREQIKAAVSGLQHMLAALETDLMEQVARAEHKKRLLLQQESAHLKSVIGDIAVDCDLVEEMLQVGHEERLLWDGPALRDRLQGMLGRHPDHGLAEMAILQFTSHTVTATALRELVGFLQTSTLDPQATTLGPGPTGGCINRAFQHVDETLTISVGSYVEGDIHNLSVTLTGPDGEKSPVQLTDNKDGTYTLGYAPQSCGVYHLRVFVYGCPVPGSPFPIIVMDPELEEHWRDPAFGGGSGRTNRVRVSRLSLAAVEKHLRGNNSPLRPPAGSVPRTRRDSGMESGDSCTKTDSRSTPGVDGVTSKPPLPKPNSRPSSNGPHPASRRSLQLEEHGPATSQTTLPRRSVVVQDLPENSQRNGPVGFSAPHSMQDKTSLKVTVNTRISDDSVVFPQELVTEKVNTKQKPTNHDVSQKQDTREKVVLEDCNNNSVGSKPSTGDWAQQIANLNSSSAQPVEKARDSLQGKSAVASRLTGRNQVLPGVERVAYTNTEDLQNVGDLVRESVSQEEKPTNRKLQNEKLQKAPHVPQEKISTVMTEAAQPEIWTHLKQADVTSGGFGLGKGNSHGPEALKKNTRNSDLEGSKKITKTCEVIGTLENPDTSVNVELTSPSIVAEVVQLAKPLDVGQKTGGPVSSRPSVDNTAKTAKSVPLKVATAQGLKKNFGSSIQASLVTACDQGTLVPLVGQTASIPSENLDTNVPAGPLAIVDQCVKLPTATVSRWNRGTEVPSKPVSSVEHGTPDLRKNLGTNVRTNPVAAVDQGNKLPGAKFSRWDMGSRMPSEPIIPIDKATTVQTNAAADQDTKLPRAKFSRWGMGSKMPSEPVLPFDKATTVQTTPAAVDQGTKWPRSIASRWDVNTKLPAKPVPSVEEVAKEWTPAVPALNQATKMFTLPTFGEGSRSKMAANAAPSAPAMEKDAGAKVPVIPNSDTVLQSKTSENQIPNSLTARKSETAGERPARQYIWAPRLKVIQETESAACPEPVQEYRKSVIQQHLERCITGQRDIQAKHVKTLYRWGYDKNSCLSFPIGVTTGKDQDVIVCNSANNAVEVFSWEGKHKVTINSSFYRPSAVVANGDGDIFVKDDTMIRVFSCDGKFLRSFGKGALSRPYGLSWSKDGNLVLVNTGRRTIIQYSPEGSLVTERPYDPLHCVESLSHSQSKCRFLTCHHDTLVVTDLGLNIVHVTTVKGLKVGYFGNLGSEPGCMNEPSGVTVDDQGNLVIADSKNHRVQVFSLDGNFLCGIRLDHSLRRPSDIHLTNDGFLLVSNLLDHNVKIFQLHNQ